MPLFLASPFTKLGLILLLAVALFSYGWVKGGAGPRAEMLALRTNLDVSRALELQRQAGNAKKAEALFDERLRTARRHASTTTREVPVYVTPKDDAACTVPVGFVSVLDRAADGLMRGADTASGADDTTSAIRPTSRKP